jgi:5,10-methylenetetrahydrofolate reductase
MDDKQILEQINGLIRSEHELRQKVAAGEITADAEHEQLRSVEEALDQCWDLLRQRRARKEFGDDPDEATSRPGPEVESYLQ